MGENRDTDSKPQPEKDTATGKPDAQPSGTKPSGTQDELTKAQEDAARERAENGGYQ